MIELLVMQLFFPPVLGYLATTKGYKFWAWALIGFFVPVITVFILFAMKKRIVQPDEKDRYVYINHDKIIWSKDQKVKKLVS
jgi:hypothetical protein